MDMIHVKTAIHKKMNKIEITDLALPELQVYTSLNEAQLLHYYEPAPGIFIAESPKVIERALEFGCEPISLLMEQKDFDTRGKNIIAKCKNIPVYTAKIEVLEQITGYKLARGMLCAMHRPAMPSAEEVCKNARRIAVLENVVNPTNVGAIFRSAAALNMDAVLLTSACSDPLYRRSAWEQYFRCCGLTLKIKMSPGRRAAWIYCMSMDLRRLPWHFGMILSVLMIKNYMQKKSLQLF